jgi:flagellar protein FliJ
MKKYQFPLDKVLKVKTIELDKLVLQLSQVRHEIHITESKKAELVQVENQLNQTYLAQINQSLTSYELSQINYKKESLKHQIKLINEKIMELKRTESLVLERVIDKKKEQSTLNKLDEKLLEEHNTLAHKQEREINDEMLVMKINRKNG